MAEDMWQAFAASVELGQDRSPVRRPSQKDVNTFELTFDFILPRSYRAFVKRFGPGRLGHEFLLSAPGNLKNKKNASLDVRGDQHRQALSRVSGPSAGPPTGIRRRPLDVPTEADPGEQRETVG